MLKQQNNPHVNILTISENVSTVQKFYQLLRHLTKYHYRHSQLTIIPSTKDRYTTAIWMSAVGRHKQILIYFFTVSITWSNNFLLASSIYSGIWHTCTNGVNNGCRKSAYGQEILPPIMSGKVTTHAAITYGRVNVRARVPKGAFIWPGLFYIKKTAIKTVFELHVFFLWIHIVVLSPF